VLSNTSRTGVDRESERAGERALMQRCKNGDIGAFDELYKRYEKRVFNCAYHICGNYHDASDITQEAFIRVYNSIQTFRGDANFLTWIYRIVTNVYLDERKKSKAHRQSSLDEFIELDENAVSRQIIDDSPLPAEVVESKERAEVVRAAINSLPEYQRMIVTLYHVEDLSYDEIAGILQLPIGTVKSRLNRARLALAQILGARPELFG
jgi:RNA polymerase sigma-70 factor (ECF subfamily)